MLHVSPTQLAPAIIIPFVAWRVYVRFRRNVGRQAFAPRRLVTRIVIFSVASAVLALFTLVHPPSLAALAGGLVLGVPLALIGLHLTRFETTPAGRFYTPNTHIGVGLTLLLVARMGYRATVLLTTPLDSAPPAALFHSPLTMVIFGVTAGYYVAYYSGLLAKAKRPD